MNVLNEKKKCEPQKNAIRWKDRNVFVPMEPANFNWISEHLPRLTFSLLNAILYTLSLSVGYFHWQYFNKTQLIIKKNRWKSFTGFNLVDDELRKKCSHWKSVFFASKLWLNLFSLSLSRSCCETGQTGTSWHLLVSVFHISLVRYWLMNFFQQLRKYGEWRWWEKSHFYGTYYIVHHMHSYLDYL